jgi:hypothetical protein
MRCDVPVNSETLLVADFINLKIMPAQSFEGDHRDRVCVRMFIGMNTHMYMSICVYTVFLTKITCSKTVRVAISGLQVRVLTDD